MSRWRGGADGSLADLKIWGPDGAGDPAPAAADPVKYTRMSLNGFNGLKVVRC
jgi:hypothetical protein